VSEKRVVTNRDEASVVRQRLIDPRRIKQITLVATDDQPRIDGYKTERIFPVSVWAATNPACHKLLVDYTEIPVSTHMGSGTGTEGLVKLAIDHATAALRNVSGNCRARLQFKEIPNYPADRSGPGQCGLVTIDEDNANENQRVIIIGGDALIPARDAQGGELIEFRVESGTAQPTNAGLQGHLARNEQMWAVWSKMGISEQTCLRVDFQFYSAQKQSTERLTETLQAKQFAVSAQPKRTLLFLKGWDITASESAWWTLERLQWQTRELYQLAERLDIGLEGVGALIGTSA
jgi:hypothetical protein